MSSQTVPLSVVSVSVSHSESDPKKHHATVFTLVGFIFFDVILPVVQLPLHWAYYSAFASGACIRRAFGVPYDNANGQTVVLPSLQYDDVQVPNYQLFKNLLLIFSSLAILMAVILLSRIV